MIIFHEEMASDSKILKFSDRRCSRRRELRPRPYLYNNKRRERKSSSTDRFSEAKRKMKDRHNRVVRVQRGWENTRKIKPYTTRISIHNEYTDDERKYSDEISKKEKLEFYREKGTKTYQWYQDLPKHHRNVKYLNSYENRRDHSDGNRRLSDTSRERSRSRERFRYDRKYEDKEIQRSAKRIAIPEIHDIYEPAIVRSPLPLAPPARIFVPPRLMPRLPHMRLPHPACMVRPGVRPMLLAPVIILRPPLLPLRPRFQPIELYR